MTEKHSNFYRNVYLKSKFLNNIIDKPSLVISTANRTKVKFLIITHFCFFQIANHHPGQILKNN